MHVTHPYKTVSLDTVPKILLHAKMYGICSCLPYFIKPFIVASERSTVRNIPVDGYGPDFSQMQFTVRIKQVYPDETKTGIADLLNTEPRKNCFLIAYGVIVCRPFVTCHITHSFAYRLSETDPDTNRLMICRHSGNYLDASMQFLSKIKQY